MTPLQPIILIPSQAVFASYSLIKSARQKSSKYQFYCLWLDLWSTALEMHTLATVSGSYKKHFYHVIIPSHNGVSEKMLKTSANHKACLPSKSREKKRKSQKNCWETFCQVLFHFVVWFLIKRLKCDKCINNNIPVLKLKTISYLAIRDRLTTYAHVSLEKRNNTNSWSSKVSMPVSSLYILSTSMPVLVELSTLLISLNACRRSLYCCFLWSITKSCDPWLHGIMPENAFK